MNHASKQETNPLEYWRVLVKRKGLIGIIVGISFATSVVVSLLLPKVYVSTATMLPFQQEDSSGRHIGVKSISDRWVEILKSRVIMDAVVKRHGLAKVFEVKSTEAAGEVLGEMLSIKNSREGIISVSVESKDPQLAADLANTFLEELGQYNRKLGLTTGTRKIVFIEGRLDETGRELAKVEEALKTFLGKNSSVELDDKSMMVISAIGGLRGQIMAKELELKALVTYGSSSPSSHFMVAASMTRLEWLYSRLNELSRLHEFKEWPGWGAHSREGIFISEDVFIPTEKISESSAKYVQLLLGTKVQKAFYELLTKQYEMVKEEGKGGNTTIQVLGMARVPDRASKPKKALIVELATMAAVFFAVFLAFFLEYIQDLRAREVGQNEEGKAETREKRISDV